jgi:hypothetical protein
VSKDVADKSSSSKHRALWGNARCGNLCVSSRLQISATHRIGASRFRDRKRPETKLAGLQKKIEETEARRDKANEELEKRRTGKDD